jgi:radical SAM protein with 4Fe4S-binding SPASM domain
MMIEQKNEYEATDKAELITQIKAAGLHPPETMTLMTTDGCNLRCRHCWLDCRSLEKANRVSTAKVQRVINGFGQLGGTHINLTGGEILSHPGWHRILQFCFSHARINTVCLQTNATLISRKHIELLLEFPPARLKIQVSLDGARARTHDLVRGPGSFGRTVAGLRLLAEAGLGPQTQVAFTEMVHNFNELPQLLESLIRMGIGRLVSSTLVKGGRATQSAYFNLPTPAQYWELVHLYQTDAGFKQIYDQKANFAAIEWFKNRSKATDNKCDCLKNLFVDSRGYLYPCTMLLLDRFASESVYTQPLDQVIRKTLSKWIEIPLMSRQRQNVIQSCSRCVNRNHCGGGCMGRAATSSGELMTPEDRCALRKAVYHWTELPSVGSFCRGR